MSADKLAEKLQEYLNSVGELEKARSKVRKYGEQLTEVARALNNHPHKVTVSNAQVMFPITEDREYVLNANDWPSAKQLAEVLSDYIQKRTKASKLYSSLTEAQKAQLKPHPDI